MLINIQGIKYCQFVYDVGYWPTIIQLKPLAIRIKQGCHYQSYWICERGESVNVNETCVWFTIIHGIVGICSAHKYVYKFRV